MVSDHIAIVDYGMGNAGSIVNAFSRLKIPCSVARLPEQLSNARKIVLPGVGNFSQGIANLRKSGLYNVIQEKVCADKTPILGICLGFQFFMRHSQEGGARGFGWIGADVVRFSFHETKLRVPHVGWNHVVADPDNILFQGISLPARFYFTHSFFVGALDEGVGVGRTDYGVNFVSAIQKENIFGTQFHPEKSHQAGLRLLKNFAEIP